MPPLPDTNCFFWLYGHEAAPSRGFLELPKSGLAVATVDEVLHDDPTVSEQREEGQYSLAISAEADKQVKSFAARDVHCTLDSGDLVSLLRANNHGGTGHHTYPEYRSRRVVFGAHVADTQVYSAMRFRLDARWWLSHIVDGETAEVPDDRSVLSFEVHGDEAWLVYEAARPATLEGLSRRVISACRFLSWLTLGTTLEVLRTEVRACTEGQWMRVYGQSFESEEGAERTSLFLDPALLTLERFAGWIAVHEQLDGLDWAVKELTGGGPVQVRTLLGATLIEGYHRRLRSFSDGTMRFPQRRFPEASKSELRNVRLAAKSGAEVEATKYATIDAEVIAKATNDALSHLGDVGFANRAVDILTDIADVVPDLIQSVPNLAKVVKDARNDLAHHLTGRDGPGGTAFHRWTIVAHSIPWLLRAFLLGLVGYEKDRLNRAFLQCQQYEFACANVRLFIEELEQMEA
ncbi:HEPN domain-containing protein [Gordonia sp. NPDC003504]